MDFRAKNVCPIAPPVMQWSWSEAPPGFFCCNVFSSKSQIFEMVFENSSNWLLESACEQFGNLLLLGRCNDGVDIESDFRSNKLPRWVDKGWRQFEACTEAIPAQRAPITHCLYRLLSELRDTPGWSCFWDQRLHGMDRGQGGMSLLTFLCEIYLGHAFHEMCSHKWRSWGCSVLLLRDWVCAALEPNCSNATSFTL